ncbi:SDR family oxidoreductase [Roseibium suaedae]|uniref:NAD(P)H dehydrogenase (Quinone) n=1 Tax=Roseibium suaedae TaxID=735517 RepID=A0A1M7C5M3_9HYPH|nr:SDR family oxidoreductase [Roseibium suaedae]SHL62159.1 NAD(P)H dehydrogenase (quinone) [Roseibium suaedae]
MIAVTGANGQLGRLVLEALTAKGATSVRALVRSPEKAQDLASSTVSLAEADYTKPDTLAKALAGVERLLLISSNEIGQRTTQHLAVIDAAKAAGVKLIAYTSLLHADTSKMALAPEHKATEEALAASGISYVLLRNGWYLENFDAALASGLEHGAIAGAAGEGKIAAASRKDYAEAAAAVLLGADTSSRTYELAGSPAFTLSELAASLSEASGKEIPYHDMPEADYAKLLTQVGLPEAFAGVLADSDANAAKGSLYETSDDLEQLTGRKSLSYKEYVRSFLAR